MPYARISDDLLDRLLYLGLSRSARYLYLELTSWSSRMLTDGRIPLAAVRRITDSDDVDADLVALREQGLVTVTGGEVVLVEYLDDQATREQVLASKDANRERQARYRLAQSLHAIGDHSRCSPKRCAAAPRVRSVTA